jgi:uncharacterized protein (DUF362 family)
MITNIYLEKRDCFTYPSSDNYYSPHISYPEYPFSTDTISPEPNEAYDMVRSSLYGLGLDAENFGTNKWNPLGEYVKANSRILIKPNWVNHENPVGGLDCTVTHPSIIRCMIDYCVIAKAQIIEIGDAPIQDCDFDRLMEIQGYNRMFSFFQCKGIQLVITDFRITISEKSVKGTFLQKKNVNIDNTKIIEFDLKNSSHFNDLTRNHRYRIANYYDDNLNTRHNKDHHKYLIAKSVVDADLIINLPKPKTHRFAGLTGAQKNFIGICVDKEYLPHYRVGTPVNEGDESNIHSALGDIIAKLNQRRCKYIEKQKINMQLFYKFFMAGIKRMQKIARQEPQFVVGQWYGNDTIWRTVLDINFVLLYGNKDGILDMNSMPRNILNIGDLIIAGEKNGPLEPSPKPLGIILASNNCSVFDYVFCKITGFDYNIIPTIKNSISNPYLINDLFKGLLKSNLLELNNTPLQNIEFPSDWHFIPHPFWNDILL